MLSHQRSNQHNINIKSIKTTPGSIFNIIQTQSNDYYYSSNDDPVNPIKLQQAELNDTANIFISDGENNEYWAYNNLGSRERLYIFHRHREIYHFDEPAFSHSYLNLNYSNFHVLDNRWVVVFIFSNDDKSIICRTHDLLKRKNSQSHLIPGLGVNSQDCIYTYSVDNQIIIITPDQIAKLSIQPDCGDGFTRLDFKQVPNPIITTEIKWFSLQIFVKKMAQSANNITHQQEPSGAYPGQFLNIYSHNTYRSHSEHSFNDKPLLLGTINSDTLDIKCYYSQPKIPAIMIHQQHPQKEEPSKIPGVFPGIFEYLAPDIIIHRPDIGKLTQYLTLLVPTHAESVTPYKSIIINIHEFEHKKEQRKYKVVDMKDNGMTFTIIYTKFQDDTWTIYQVDRYTQKIYHMVIPKPKLSTQDFHIEILQSGKIRIYKFNVFRETIRCICPCTTNLVMILDKLPEPAAYQISKFAKQKIIIY